MTVRDIADELLPVATGAFAKPAADYFAGELKKVLDPAECAALKTFLTDVTSGL